MKRILSLLLVCFTLNVFCQQKNQKVAFLSDIHFQDLYGNFSDHDFSGVTLPGTDKKAILRTMASQLRSTRIFNENYYAFIAALEDLTARGIRIVALPGDYTDDGQAYNLRGLRKILEHYQATYGIRFFITTGNHDPVGPFWQDAGKSDFLNEDGNPLGIYSSSSIVRRPELPHLITRDIATSGYLEILNELKGFGFNPDERDLYWATPFNSGRVEDYDFHRSKNEAGYEKRMYEVSAGFRVPDLSYVVEPVDGLWLLALDGNTYIPKNLNGSPDDVRNYSDANIGYNNVMTHKRHLIEWVRNLTAEASRLNKTLVAFTHYPMIDYNDNASGVIADLLGESKWQLRRAPSEEVAAAFAEAGLQIHFGGHMHINDTGVRRFEGNKTLVNIQVPSLAAYLPGYKILTISSPETFEVETIILDEVKGFDELFPLYEKEYQVLKEKRAGSIWSRNILTTKSYREFTLFHLQELVRLRMIPSDWPKDFIEKSEHLTGKDFLELSMAEERLLKKELRKNKLNASRFGNWSFNDLLLDIYKFQSADELARTDIPEKRLKEYAVLNKFYENLNTTDVHLQQIRKTFKMLSLLSNGDPSDHFKIDLKTGTLQRFP